MTWEIFREINRSLFAWPNKITGTSFYKLAAALVSAAGLIGAYLKAPDRAAHWLIQNLVTFPALKSSDALNSWDSGSHAVLRVVSTLVLLSAMYAVSFVLVAQERLDYRHQQARALGIKFLKVQRSHDILNLAGDCRTVSAEDFEVYGIHLSHIDRHIRLTTGDKWPNAPKITAENLPPGSAMTAQWNDDGPHRTYVLNFTIALHETAKPVHLRTTDEIPRAFWMYEQDTPTHPVLGGKVEATSWFVVEPIEQLEISVTFPYGYLVGGQSQVSVRYNRTRTVHNGEEERLRNSYALTPVLENGKQTLRLRVAQPVLGLHYYLYWEPPKRA